MALGSVNMVSFVPKEIGALIGNTSVIPFTRAEIEALVNRKAYPEGKLVYTGSTWVSYNSDGTYSFPEDVDYVKLTCTNCSSYVPNYQYLNGIKVAKGSVVYSANDSYVKADFSTPGTLRLAGYSSAYKNDRAYYTAEAYRYF